MPHFLPSLHATKESSRALPVTPEPFTEGWQALHRTGADEARAPLHAPALVAVVTLAVAALATVASSRSSLGLVTSSSSRTGVCVLVTSSSSRTGIGVLTVSSLRVAAGVALAVSFTVTSVRVAIALTSVRVAVASRGSRGGAGVGVDGSGDESCKSTC
jgi:hypothetical protein